MTDDPLEVTRNGEPANIANLWAPCPAFLVCGGPSLNDHPLHRLRERGVVSLAVNQAAAWAPVKAWTFSDPGCKFHHSMFLDPAVMTFAPGPKLRHKISIKLDGRFRASTVRGRDCPNTYAYGRMTYFVPETFFETKYAHWGPGKHQPPDVEKVGCLCTMLIGIRLLHFLGVKRMYLLGVDFKGRDGMCYGFPERKRERNRRYKWEREMLELLVPVFERRGVELYNCNEMSSCDLFPYVPFDVALDDCKGDVGKEPLDTLDWYDKKLVWAEMEKSEPYTPKHF